MLVVDPYPLLELAAFTTVFPRPLGDLSSPAWLTALLARNAPAPLQRSEQVRQAVRDLLRQRGYKPTGRGKPASEYLVRAAEEGTLASINAAVDCCNAVSLHSGLPISVIDVDRAQPPFSVAAAPAGTRYVFNPAGQEIDVAGLPCLADAQGPCANAVKDAQRTKTDAATTRTLTVIWSTVDVPGRAAEAERWYRELLGRVGATTEDAPRQRPGA
jgi:DNA/RNA-binding domain of Phe-tRNA-synthetase-like protein